MKTITSICPSCNGSGKAKYKIIMASTTGPIPQSVIDAAPFAPCDHCRGTGFETLHLWEPADFEEARKILERK